MRLAMFSMPTHPPGRPVWQTYQDDFETFEIADQLGFDAVWIGEHFTSAWENIPDRKKGTGKFYRKGSPGGWAQDLTTEQHLAFARPAEQRG